MSVEDFRRYVRRAEHGYPRLMCDAIDDRTRADGKMRGMQNARYAAISGRPALVLPGGPDADDKRAADELRESIDEHNIDLHAYLSHAVKSPLKYGWSLSEQVWQWNAEANRYDVVELHHIRCRNTRISSSTSGDRGALADEILVQVGRYEHDVERQTPGKYIEIRGEQGETAVWAGVGVTSALWSTLKMQGVAGYQTYLDRYGLPFLEVAVDDWSSASDRETAREIVRNFGRDAGIVRPRNAKIEVKIHDGAAGSRNANSDVHARYIDLANAENAILWLGAPYATESGAGGASYALAVEQGNVAFRLTLNDRDRIEAATKRDWFSRWMRYNGRPGRTPRLRVLVERVERPEIAVKMAKELAEVGYNVDPEQLQEMTGFRPARPDMDEGDEAESEEQDGDE
jgi:hypothetical protein